MVFILVLVDAGDVGCETVQFLVEGTVKTAAKLAVGLVVHQLSCYFDLLGWALFDHLVELLETAKLTTPHDVYALIDSALLNKSLAFCALNDAYSWEELDERCS